MKLTARIPVTAALLALMLGSVTGCNRLKARDQLTKGVQAFKNARYEEAVNHFQQSIALDPSYDQAKLYLATAYSYQVVPNLDTPENLAVAKKALEGFQEILAKDPNDLSALKQIASIYFNTKKLAEAVVLYTDIIVVIEVVDAHDRVTGREQLFAHLGGDETCGAGHQIATRCIINDHRLIFNVQCRISGPHRWLFVRNKSEH